MISGVNDYPTFGTYQMLMDQPRANMIKLDSRNHAMFQGSCLSDATIAILKHSIRNTEIASGWADVKIT